jgi:hypothetical protein
MTKLRYEPSAEPSDGLSILFRVRDALREAGLEDHLRDFLDRIAGCRTYEELLRLADEYAQPDPGTN